MPLNPFRMLPKRKGNQIIRDRHEQVRLQSALPLEYIFEDGGSIVDVVF